MGDTAVDSLQPTGMPGAFRGGVSPGGWAGTTYSTTGLKSLVRGDKELWKFDSKQPTQLLAGGQQKCNASMNPFPANNLHPDYMLLLAFGGEYQSVTGTVKEALHENLWVYNSKNKIVAQVKRPDSLNYRLWDKPEWSTHARYATAVANPMSELDNCDLFIIDLGDLQLHSENNLAQAQATFRLASGGLTRGSYTHLWVSP